MNSPIGPIRKKWFPMVVIDHLMDQYVPLMDDLPIEEVLRRILTALSCWLAVFVYTSIFVFNGILLPFDPILYADAPLDYAVMVCWRGFTGSISLIVLIELLRERDAWHTVMPKMGMLFCTLSWGTILLFGFANIFEAPFTWAPVFWSMMSLTILITLRNRITLMATLWVGNVICFAIASPKPLPHPDFLAACIAFLSFIMVLTFFGDVVYQMSYTILEQRLSLSLQAQQLEDANVILEDRLTEQRQRMLSLLEEREIHKDRARAELARDIHDELGQCIALMQAEIARTSQYLDPERAADVVHQFSRDCKRVIAQLPPAPLEEFGVESAIEEFVRRFQNNTGRQCELVAFIDPSVLSPEQESFIYRFVQESLNNVQRHSDATTVQVSVLVNPDDREVHLSTRDNGTQPPPRSFNPATYRGDTEDSIHLGLWGLYERAGLLNGTLSFSFTPNFGAELTVSFPFVGSRGDKST